MEKSPYDLSGKVSVVTGGSSGIGAAIAEEMAGAGAQIVLVGRDEQRLDSVAHRIREIQGEAIIIAADVTADGAPARIVSETMAAYGGFNILVHSAGVYEPLPCEETPLESVDRQWMVNVRAPFAITQAALAVLKEGDVIIFVSSLAGHAGFSNSSAYSATKGAIEVMARAIAIELGPRGIRVNTIAPGWIRTRMNEHILADPEFEALQIAASPLGRLGTVDDVAPTAVFLASDAARYIQGAVIPVDGAFPAMPRL
jgi:NAD(P)-dependent dehydrogenase (short-subunit alcohol dehydrogenase family)